LLPLHDVEGEMIQTNVRVTLMLPEMPLWVPVFLRMSWSASRLDVFYYVGIIDRTSRIYRSVGR
jgi:hypothetical protein